MGRLKELEPLTRGYERLREVAGRLGLKYTPTAADADTDQPPAATRRGAARARAKPRAVRTAAKAKAARSSGKSAAKRRSRSPTSTRRPARSEPVLRVTGPRPAGRLARPFHRGVSSGVLSRGRHLRVRGQVRS